MLLLFGRDLKKFGISMKPDSPEVAEVKDNEDGPYDNILYTHTQHESIIQVKGDRRKKMSERTLGLIDYVQT